MTTHDVVADQIVLAHTQTTLGNERIGSVPGGQNPPNAVTDSLTITVTNGTNITWEDYTFFFDTPMGSTIQPEILQISNATTTVFGRKTIVGRSELDVDQGTLDPMKSFTVTLDLSHNNSTDIRGAPSFNEVSAIPEPSTFGMVGAGLIGLLAMAIAQDGARLATVFDCRYRPLARTFFAR
jgi:hypothetical protein